ncbi:ATP-binding cassette domain-containing protein [Limosilactobacillus fermentum]|uniref:ATP-binding cassette domain-containing protein n=1 Tax=Limosilactobacillus fermentum TaxID=1613 RepID=UPI002165D9C5|nr:ABC transporter ATP-binding protein [Limosilactobacillus fermentum]UVW04285.1 ABC transporter ATP-binding protein [Limosilactobacillus fermentum]WEN04902.1 ABC transporter ATP-binding protein [Limosilactobacillus fermentum]WEN11757.1 ABC transporter ATP-binding protein [Limosilactobacillus fermentum]WJD38412.1 ABC transporter ATP-binding protein [Limosilactobacillus fermentum]
MTVNELMVNHVTKRYRRHTVIDEVNFNLAPAKIYGLLGRNGAGKSTLLNIITNRIFPTSGMVAMGPQNVNNNDEELGKIYLMSESNMYPKTTRVKRMLSDADRFYGKFDFANARRMLGQFGINEKDRFSKLSTGQKTAVKITIALNVNAQYVLLDEPTLGLDVNYRETFYRELLRTYSEKPRTFVLSTHLISEVQQLVEDVLILHEGKIIVNEPVEELLGRAFLVSGPAQLVDEYTAGQTTTDSQTIGNLKETAVIGELDALRPIPDQVQIKHLDLQRAFTALTNH